MASWCQQKNIMPIFIAWVTSGIFLRIYVLIRSIWAQKLELVVLAARMIGEHNLKLVWKGPFERHDAKNRYFQKKLLFNKQPFKGQYVAWDFLFFFVCGSTPYIGSRQRLLKVFFVADINWPNSELSWPFRALVCIIPPQPCELTSSIFMPGAFWVVLFAPPLFSPDIHLSSPSFSGKST